MGTTLVQQGVRKQGWGCVKRQKSRKGGLARFFVGGFGILERCGQGGVLRRAYRGSPERLLRVARGDSLGGGQDKSPGPIKFLGS